MLLRIMGLEDHDSLMCHCTIVPFAKRRKQAPKGGFGQTVRIWPRVSGSLRKAFSAGATWQNKRVNVNILRGFLGQPPEGFDQETLQCRITGVSPVCARIAGAPAGDGGPFTPVCKGSDEILLLKREACEPRFAQDGAPQELSRGVLCRV